MVVGRLFHYSADIVLLSTVLAGIKRTSGFQVTTSTIPEGPFRTTAETVLSIGEHVFDYTTAFSYTSSYFERGNATSSSTSPGGSRSNTKK